MNLLSDTEPKIGRRCMKSKFASIFPQKLGFLFINTGWRTFVLSGTARRSCPGENKEEKIFQNNKPFRNNFRKYSHLLMKTLNWLQSFLPS
jgi:hypothetical protein